MRKAVFFFLFLTAYSFSFAQTWETEYQKSSVKPNNLWLDFFIPGYGMFSQKEYFWGSIYAISKISVFYLSIFSWNRYSYYDSIGNASERIDSTEPGTLLFRDPNNPEKYLSAEEYRSKSDQYFLFFIYSVILEGALHVVSYYHSKSLWNQKNRYKRAHYRLSHTQKVNIKPFLKLGKDNARFGVHYRFQT